MSPPEPDPKKMERRHRPALRGMLLAVAVAVVAIVAVVAFRSSMDIEEAAPANEVISD